MLQEGRLPPAIQPPFGTKRRAAKLGIERVRHAIDLAGGESGVVQTEPYRILGQHVRVVDPRLFCMLDAGEPLFFAGGHHLAVENQCGCGFAKDRIDSENVHATLFICRRPSWARTKAASGRIGPQLRNKLGVFPAPCGEGLGVGVGVCGRSSSTTTTPLPNPPPQGGGSTPVRGGSLRPFHRRAPAHVRWN